MRKLYEENEANRKKSQNSMQNRYESPSGDLSSSLSAQERRRRDYGEYFSANAGQIYGKPSEKRAIGNDRVLKEELETMTEEELTLHLLKLKQRRNVLLEEEEELTLRLMGMKQGSKHNDSPERRAERHSENAYKAAQQGLAQPQRDPGPYYVSEQARHRGEQHEREDDETAFAYTKRRSKPSSKSTLAPSDSFSDLFEAEGEMKSLYDPSSSSASARREKERRRHTRRTNEEHKSESDIEEEEEEEEQQQQQQKQQNQTAERGLTASTGTTQRGESFNRKRDRKKDESKSLAKKTTARDKSVVSQTSVNKKDKALFGFDDMGEDGEDELDFGALLKDANRAKTMRKGKNGNAVVEEDEEGSSAGDAGDLYGKRSTKGDAASQAGRKRGELQHHERVGAEIPKTARDKSGSEASEEETAELSKTAKASLKAQKSKSKSKKHSEATLTPRPPTEAYPSELEKSKSKEGVREAVGDNMKEKRKESRKDSEIASSGQDTAKRSKDAEEPEKRKSKEEGNKIHKDKEWKDRALKERNDRAQEQLAGEDNTQQSRKKRRKSRETEDEEEGGDTNTAKALSVPLGTSAERVRDDSFDLFQEKMIDHENKDFPSNTNIFHDDDARATTPRREQGGSVDFGSDTANTMSTHTVSEANARQKHSHTDIDDGRGLEGEDELSKDKGLQQTSKDDSDPLFQSSDSDFFGQDPAKLSTSPSKAYDKSETTWHEEDARGRRLHQRDEQEEEEEEEEEQQEQQQQKQGQQQQQKDGKRRNYATSSQTANAAPSLEDELDMFGAGGNGGGPGPGAPEAVFGDMYRNNMGYGMSTSTDDDDELEEEEEVEGDGSGNVLLAQPKTQTQSLQTQSQSLQMLQEPSDTHQLAKQGTRTNNAGSEEEKHIPAVGQPTDGEARDLRGGGGGVEEGGGPKGQKYEENEYEGLEQGQAHGHGEGQAQENEQAQAQAHGKEDKQQSNALEAVEQPKKVSDDDYKAEWESIKREQQLMKRQRAMKNRERHSQKSHKKSEKRRESGGGGSEKDGSNKSKGKGNKYKHREKDKDSVGETVAADADKKKSKKKKKDKREEAETEAGPYQPTRQKEAPLSSVLISEEAASEPVVSGDSHDPPLYTTTLEEGHTDDDGCSAKGSSRSVKSKIAFLSAQNIPLGVSAGKLPPKPSSSSSSPSPSFSTSVPLSAQPDSASAATKEPTTTTTTTTTRTPITEDGGLDHVNMSRPVMKSKKKRPTPQRKPVVL